MSFFGENEAEAIKSYIQKLTECCDRENIKTTGHLSDTWMQEISGSRKGWRAIIGDHEFVKNSMDQYNLYLHRLHHKADYPYLPERTLKKICTEQEISISEL